MTTRQIAIAHPSIGEEEKRAVLAVLESGQLVQGEKVAAFERAFAEVCGVKHAIATSNGTTALTTALMACNIGSGDEVIIPSFSFIATATSVLSVGAKPVFVDIEAETFCLDPQRLEAAITPRTRAVMPVHLYGHPANMDAINAVAEKHGLVVVEDAAQAHGASIGTRCAGAWGKAAGFSFYATKNIMTGEGGMVTTNDDEVARRAMMIRQHGMNVQYYHELIGFNFRMTNIMAAIGLAQVKKLGGWNEQRAQNASYLSDHLRTMQTPRTKPGYRHVFHQYTVTAPEGADRDAVVKRLNERGIGARIYYPLPIHRQPVFVEMGYNDAALPVTEAMTRRVFSLPVHPFLTQEDLEYIVAEVNAL